MKAVVDEFPVIGAGAGGKGGSGGGGLSEQEDSLKSTSYAQVLDLVSEGEIGGLVDGLKSIYLDGVAVQNADGTSNFTGVTYTTTLGTQSQGVIAGYDETRSEFAVGLEAKISTGPIARSISSSVITSVIVTVNLPALTFLDNQGNLGGSSVNFAIDVQLNGGGWVEKINDTITGKSSGAYQRQYRIILPAGATRNIRLRRITPDATSSSLNNKTFFQSYTEIIDAQLRYPNSALIGVKVDASQFRSIPTRGYDVKLLKVRFPTNATVRADGSLAYTGTWDGTFQVGWCADPAWAYYDLVTTDRYGLGSYISTAQISKWDCYAISKYCAELIPNGFGGTEPRFNLNVWINTRQEAYKLLADLTSCFRGMAFWGSGAIALVQDAPKDPSYLFTNSNVIDGLFRYEGSSAKARHTVALVTWNDPADLYKQKIEYVEADAATIARYGIIETEVLAFGCTSRGQAHRVGLWLLYSERAETEVCTFRTGGEGVMCLPGDIIKVADQHRAGARQGGRVSAATSTSITVDSLASAPAAGSTIYVIGSDGVVQQRTTGTVAGNIINVSPALSPVPPAGAVWVVSTTGIAAQTFRVMSVSETADGEHEILALAHDPSKFAAIETGAPLQPQQITSLSPVPNPVATVTLSESLYRYQNDVRSKITASWPAALNASAYRVRWRQNNGNWIETTTSALDVEILDTIVATYDVEVVSVGVFGAVARSGTTASINALGKTAAPSDVAGLTVTIDPRIGITLNWAAIPDLDADTYEIRTGASWAAGTLVAQISGTSYKIGTINGSSQTFFVKAVDTTGNYSTNAASVTTSLAVPSAPASPSVQVIDNNVLLRWSASGSTLAIDGYEIRRGATFAGGTVVGRVQSTFSAIFETTAGTYTYWIVGIDIGGNYGTPVSVVASVAAPPDYTLLTNYVSTLTGTLSNAVLESGKVYLPADSSETFQAHFTARSWASPQDQVTAGYGAMIQPTASSGYYEEILDYGSTIAACKVAALATIITEIGAPVVTPMISVSNTSSSGPWTDYSGVTEVYATTFRWVRVRFTVTSSGGDDMVSISSLSIKLDAKQISDYGMVSANAADSGGTVVNFNRPFLDVNSIVLTPLGTTPLSAMYDFADVPNPTSFKVLLFNSAGTRVSGTVSWSVRGY